MRATIKTIAEMAGVSKSTVDRALKGQPGVHPDTREKILQVAEECGYQINVAGRALRRQRSPLRIAVVFCWRMFDCQIRDGIRAAEREFETLGIQLEFYDLQTSGWEEQFQVLQLLRSAGVRGILLKAVDHPEIVRIINELQRDGVQVVTISTDLPQSRRTCFLGQNYNQAGRVAGSLMNTLLRENGNVTILQESTEYQVYREREAGFIQHLRERNSAITVQTVHCIAETLPENYEQVLDYLHRTPDVDGIFCTGYSYLYAAQALLDCGRTNIRLIGYDIYPETVPFMKQGAVDFIITQNPFRQGYEGVRGLFQYLVSNQPYSSDTVYTPVSTFNCEALDGIPMGELSRI
ncbi:MAG: substrate-binding domain-containing protein [Butyricicoccus sp.]